MHRGYVFVYNIYEGFGGWVCYLLYNLVDIHQVLYSRTYKYVYIFMCIYFSYPLHSSSWYTSLVVYVLFLASSLTVYIYMYCIYIYMCRRTCWEWKCYWRVSEGIPKLCWKGKYTFVHVGIYMLDCNVTMNSVVEYFYILFFQYLMHLIRKEWKKIFYITRLIILIHSLNSVKIKLARYN